VRAAVGWTTGRLRGRASELWVRRCIRWLARGWIQPASSEAARLEYRVLALLGHLITRGTVTSELGPIRSPALRRKTFGKLTRVSKQKRVGCQLLGACCVLASMRSKFPRLRLVAFPVALLLALAAASAADAHSRTVAPPGNSAVSQYLETVPTASGAKPTASVQLHGGPHAGEVAVGGSGGRQGGGAAAGGTPISSSTAKSLAAHGPVGALAASVALATAPRSGRRDAASRIARSSHSQTSAAVASSPMAPSSVLSAVAGSSSGGGLGVLLPILLAVILLGGGGLAIVRRRTKAGPPTT
jgi:hypothetical protein